MDFGRPDAHGVGAYLTEPESLLGVQADAYSIGQLSLDRKWPLVYKAIEFGWMVNPSKWGDQRPHLFIALRFTAKGLCLIGIPNLEEPNKACPEDAYVQISKSQKPGIAVGNTGQPQMYHVGYSWDNKAWWVQYGNEWLGYINESYFDAPGYVTGFQQAQEVKWQGEVAFTQSWCTPMGNGRYGSDPQSASMTGMFYEVMEGGKSVAKPAAAKLLPPSDAGFWNADQFSNTQNGFNGFHYGGPEGAPNACGVG